MESLIKKFRGDMAKALARTFFARGVASVGSFFLVVVLGRLYGASGVGAFALAQSLVAAVAVFGRWGMNNALIRFIGRDIESPKVHAYLRYACIKTVIISSFGMAAVFFLRHVISGVFKSPELPGLLIGIAVSIPAFVLSFLLSGFMAAIRKPATACLLQNGAIAFIASVAVLVLQFSSPYHDGMVNIGIAYGAAAWIVCFWGIWVTWRWLRRRPITKASISRSDVEEFKRSSSAFLATDIASFMISVVGIWVAGYWLPTSSVGLYKAARQLSMLIGVILTVINLIIPTRFSRLYHTGDLIGLERLARRGAYLGLGLAALPLSMCLFLPSLVLQVVGHGFTDAALLLQILAMGQIFNLGCGSVGHVLNMTGHESISRNIAWASNTTGLLVLGIGTPLIGVVGVAIGVAVSISLRKLVGTYFVWRKLGIWTPPVPNLLRLVGVPEISIH